jgi:hypothetical protein
MKKWLFIPVIIICIAGCNNSNSNTPVVGFADAFQDNTIDRQKTVLSMPCKKMVSTKRKAR